MGSMEPTQYIVQKDKTLGKQIPHQDLPNFILSWHASVQSQSGHLCLICGIQINHVGTCNFVIIREVIVFAGTMVQF